MNENKRKSGLENVYNYHHRVERGWGFIVLAEERGNFFKKKIGKNKKILDLGCRDGSLTKYYNKGNEIIGVDIDSEALSIAQKSIGIETRYVDLNGEWNLPEDYFDVVVMAEILEHLYYPEKILEKAVRCLKEDGVLVGSVPHALSLQNRIKLFLGTKKGTPLQDPTHINHFSYKEFKSLLQQKFSVVELYPIISKKFSLLSKIFPFLFAHTLLFYAKK